VKPARSATVQVAGRVSYRESIESFYRAHPEGTLEQARKATGAPRGTVRTVRGRLVASGRLKPLVVHPDSLAAV